MNKKDYALASLSGILLAFAFPMFDLEYLAWIGLIPLFFSIRGKDLLRSIYLGLIGGLSFYLILLYWIPVPITIYGKLPLPVGILLLFLLALYLALYLATFAFLTTLFRTRIGLPLVLSAPATWVSLELMMTHFLTGFPWGLLGYSQYLNLPLIQIADITGVYGVSFVMVMINAGVYRGIERHMEGLSFWRGRSVWAAVFVLTITLSYGYWRLSETNPPSPPFVKGGYMLSPPLKKGDTGGFLKIGIIQGNIDQDHKWDQEYQKETLDAYLSLSKKVSEGGVDLIVWPETAVPFYFQNDETYRPVIMNTAREINSYILFGSPAFNRDGEGVRYYNSAYLISPETEVVGRYDKLHLVPFGEYVPLKTLLPFVNKLVEGIGDFSTGERVKILDMPSAKIGALICYEGVFPNLVRNTVGEGATLLANITNDAWFGKTSAPYQHLSMYSLRAVENRVSVIRAANTGVSAFINKYGAITSRTGVFERGYLKAQAETSDYKTFYTRFGNIFAYLCAIMASLALISAFIRRK